MPIASRVTSKSSSLPTSTPYRGSSPTSPTSASRLRASTSARPTSRTSFSRSREEAMSLRRVKALLLEEYFITIRSLEVILDLLFLSVVSVIVFGYFSLFIETRVEGPAAHYLLLGMLLWEVV